MRHPLLRALTLTGLLGTAGLGHAATLATVDFDLDYGLPSNGVASSALHLQFYYSLSAGGLGDISTLVFDAVLLDDDDDGRVFTLAGANDDAQFTAFVARATNGLDDDFRFDGIGEAGGGVGLVDRESSLLVPSVTVTGPDLAGYRVSGLELLITDIVIDSAAQPGGFHWQLSGQLRFLGAPQPVPLPATWLLYASAGALGALRLRHRARP